MTKTPTTSKFTLCACLAAVLIIGAIALYIKRDRSFATPINLASHGSPNNWSSSIKIGIIGDSWVSGNKIDNALLDTLLKRNIPATVVSSGHPGANSRRVYRDLFLDEASPYSSHKLLFDKDIDYLVVVVGVNDSASHIGKDFYAHHVLQIITAAQTRGIYPVVLELPEYGLEDMQDSNLLSYIKHTAYRALFDTTKNDQISDYREALKDKLPPSVMNNMTLVAFTPFISSYSENKNLYDNPSHLNKEGWQRLGEYIAEALAKSHNERINPDAR